MTVSHEEEKTIRMAEQARILGYLLDRRQQLIVEYKMQLWRWGNRKRLAEIDALHHEWLALNDYCTVVLERDDTYILAPVIEDES